MFFSLRLISATALALLALSAFGAENRFRLFDHSDAERKTGFYLGLENKSTGDRLPLKTLHLYLAIGDGRVWRRIDVDRRFRSGETVTVRVELTPSNASVYLNDRPAGESRGGFRPAKSDRAQLAETESGFRSDTSYRIQQDNWRVVVGTQTVTGKVERGPAAPVAPADFPPGQEIAMPAIPDNELTVQTTFRIEPAAPAQKPAR